MKRETENLNPKKEIDPSKIYLMLMVLNYDNIAIKFPKKKKRKKKASLPFYGREIKLYN